MRQIHKHKEEAASGKKMREPLAEGIEQKGRPFTQTEIDYVISRRMGLEKEGMNEKWISEKIAGEIGRSAGSIRQMIGKLVHSRRLAENRNKLRWFSEQEIDLIIRRRIEFEEEGMNDNQIGKRIAEEMGRIASSVERKIWELVCSKRLPDNQNKQRFSGDEIALMIERRAELEREGLNDGQIAKRIAEEIDGDAESIQAKILKLAREGRITHNKNKVWTKKFSEEEVALIIRKGVELEKEGMTGWYVAERIAEEVGRSTGSVSNKIRELIKSGRLAENKNGLKTRPWGFFKNMSDEQLRSYARNEMAQKGIGSKNELRHLDSGLRDVLFQRGLLGAIFAEVEQKERDAVLGQLREAVDLYTGGKR